MTPVTIAVGVASRNRPVLLSRLLDSFLRLEPPAPHMRLLFVIVENAEAPSPEYAQTIEDFRRKLDAAGQTGAVRHAQETRLGIAYARNRVLDLAQEEECAFVAFTDDDCRVSPDWLRRLRRAQQAADADFAGGNVEYELEDDASLPRLQKLLGRALLASTQRSLRRHRRRRTGRYGTANLLVRLAFLERHGIRFDESLGFAPGEDVLFFKAMRSRGAARAHAPDALVREILTADRLSVRYLFHAHRENEIAQGLTGRKSRLHAAGNVLVYAPLCVLHAVLGLLGSGASTIYVVKRAGRIAGCVQRILGVGAAGRRHYRRTTGY